MSYSPMLVKPMHEELTEIGVKELLTASDVEQFLNNMTGLYMLVINSVCGVAASTARPAIRQVVESKSKPDRVASVFAGQDLEATQRARNYFPDIPPSSPSIAIFHEGEVVGFVPRHRIEGRDAQAVASDITAVLQEHQS